MPDLEAVRAALQAEISESHGSCTHAKCWPRVALAALPALRRALEERDALRSAAERVGVALQGYHLQPAAATAIRHLGAALAPDEKEADREES